MPANTSIIRVSIVGDGQSLIRAFRDVDDSASGFGGRMASFGPVVAGGLVAAGAGLVTLGSQFNTMDNVIATGTGAAGDALDELEQNARNVLRTTSTNMGDVGTAIADLNTNLGLTGQPLEDLSRQLIDVSRITGTDLSTNINTVSRAFGDWSVAAEDQAGTLDMLFRASQATGASVDTLAGQVVQFGAPMRGMGFSLDETTALLGSFQRAGVNTELVMGSMRQALGRFAREGESAPEALARVTAEIRDMEDPTQAAARAMEVFGARAGADMADTIRAGRFEIDDLVASLQNSDGAIASTAAETSTLGDRMTILKNRVLVGLEPVATAVFDGLIRAMDILTPKAAAIVSWFQQHKAAAIALGAVVGGVLTAVMVAWTIQLVRNTAASVANSAKTIASTAAMVAQKTAMVATAIATRAYTAAQWLLNAAMNANPITLVVTALVALGAAVYLAYTRVGWFRAAVDATFGFLRDVVAGAISFIRSHWQLIVGILTGPIGIAVMLIVRYWDQIKRPVVATFNWIRDHWRLILGIITGPVGAAVFLVTRYWDQIKGAVSAVFDWISDNWKLILEIITGPIGAAVFVITNFGDDIKAVFTGVKDWVAGKVTEVVGFVTGIPGRIASAGARLFDVVKDAATGVARWVGEKVGEVVGFYLGIPGRLAAGGMAVFDVIKNAATAVKDWVAGKVTDVVDGWLNIGSRIADAGSRVFDVVKRAATAAKAWVGDKIDEVVDGWRNIGSRIAGVTVGMFDGIKNAFRAALNWVIDRWNGLSFSMPSVDTHIPGVGRIGGWSLSTPDIPRFDRGGIVSGPIGVPQLAIVHGGETILPTHRDPGLTGTTTVINHFTINVPPTANLRDVGRQITRAQREYARASGPRARAS